MGFRKPYFPGPRYARFRRFYVGAGKWPVFLWVGNGQPVVVLTQGLEATELNFPDDFSPAENRTWNMPWGMCSANSFKPFRPRATACKNARHHHLRGLLCSKASF